MDPARLGSVHLRWLAMLVVIVVGLVGCRSPDVGGPATTTTTTPVGTTSSVGSTTTSVAGPGAPDVCSAGFDSGFAIWPETTPAEACARRELLAGGADPWRADATATALRFAEEVLGWSAPQAGGPVGDEFGVTVPVVGPSGGEVPVRLVPRVDGVWWSVIGVGGDRLEGVSVSVRSGVVELGFLVGEAAEARVDVGFGAATRSATSDDGRAQLDFGETPTVPGWFLVAWLDESGAVVDAAGSVLPAGDSAAG